MIIMGVFAVVSLLAVDVEPTDRNEIESGLRGAVVFEGETPPRHTVAERMAHHNVPGLSVTLIKDGEIAWTAGYGLLEADGAIAVDENTLFQAGSIAKPVTVLAAMRMAEAGLIDLDVDVSAYLKSYTLPEGAQTADNPVTLRHLLAHTSGVTPGGYSGYARSESIPSDVQILTGEEPANRSGLQVETAPGERHAYSGHAYTLAEVVLHDVTGRDFATMMADWIFTPLGLDSLTYDMPLPAGLHDRAARGHDGAGVQVDGGWRNHPEQAAAGLWATSQDLAGLLIALHDAYRGENRLLSQSGAQMIWGEERDNHSFGWIIRDEAFVAHGGSTWGYRGYVLINPQSGDGGVVLASGDNGGALAAEILRSASDRYGWSTFTPVERARFTPEDGVLAELAGRYEFEAGWAVVIEHSTAHDQLVLVFPNCDRYALAATGPDDFIHPPTAVDVSFQDSDSGPTIHLYGQTGVRAQS